MALAGIDDAPIDLDAYRHRIGLAAPLTPTLDTLARLIERHAATIPFENIDVLCGRVPSLDHAALQHKLVQRRRGGYCFEQNGLFLACLRQAGFQVRRLEARVRAGVPADVVTGRTHMALRVTLDGADHLADVGFGALAPLAPLRLAERGEQVLAGGVYRFVDSDGELALQAAAADGWTDCYRIAAAEPQHVDHEIGNWYVATHPNAMLRHNLLVSRSVPGGRLTLFNRQLTLRPAVNSVPADERSLDSRAELADVLGDAFGLDIDAADLDAVISVLERQDA